MCLKQPLFTKNEFVEAYVIFSLFSKFFNSATSIFSTLVMSWSFSNSAVTRVCMYKFSALYLQWFQSYGQQFIWLLDVDCLADKERLKLLLSGAGPFILPPFTQLVPPLTSCDKGESIKGPAPLNKSFSLSLSVKQSTSSSQMNCSKSHKKSHKLLKLKLNIIKVMIIANKQQNY